MKFKSFSLALLASSMLLTGCGSTGVNNVLAGMAQLPGQHMNGDNVNQIIKDGVENGSSLFGNLLQGFLNGRSELTQKNIVGTWTFDGTDCVFESENLLAKAGGAIAANKIEDKLNTHLAKIGIKQGVCTFTFNEDNTFAAKVGTRNIRGRYELDAANKTMHITYLGGLAKMNPRIAMRNGQISLLMEGSKLLSVAKGLSALSNSTSLKMVSGVLDKYQGLYVGMKFKK